MGTLSVAKTSLFEGNVALNGDGGAVFLAGGANNLIVKVRLSPLDIVLCVELHA